VRRLVIGAICAVIVAIVVACATQTSSTCATLFFADPCYDGPDGSLNVGACRAGTRGCDGGACENQIVPTAETCDGIDNDCNGVVDDVDGSVDGAYHGVAYDCIVPDAAKNSACAFGRAACAEGAFACEPIAQPGQYGEECNGIDDDCNGTPDDQLNHMAHCTLPADAAAEGGCRSNARFQCEGGVLSCQPALPVSESSNNGTNPAACDGIDNDCDGTTDPQGFAYCSAFCQVDLAGCPKIITGTCLFGTCNCCCGGAC
jgi:hypothetical protein